MKPLSRKFFDRPPEVVARELLGKVLKVGPCSGVIVETEAYATDPASHAHTRTTRSAIMYDTYAHVYVYFIYGMYWCLNFTTEKNKAGAVLIRAIEPLTGIDVMRKRRGVEMIEQLCSGPGKLCQAFGIDGSFNGKLVGKEVGVFDNGCDVGVIGVSSRIEITSARDLDWRFYVEGNRFVSGSNILKRSRIKRD